MSGRAVYIRGVGAVTALGSDWPESLAALAAGDDAIVPITAFDARNFPCTVAAPIAGFVAMGERRLALARSAAREAWCHAGLEDEAVAPARLGVFLGAESGRAPFATLLELTRAAGGGPRFEHALFGGAARPLAAGFDAFIISPASVTSLLAREYGAQGPALTISLACCSGAGAIAEAARAIRQGVCDFALCGGVGADIDPMMLAGFGRLGALSALGVSRPFDARRDGFVVGEGAAMVVLSSERGDSCVELAGEGRSMDAHRLTAPDPEGDGAARAMQSALRAAGAGRVDYVQAHGTSTPSNDAVEALALQRVLGRSLDHAQVSSVKGALGHWVAGAGALGFLCAHAAVAEAILLPTAGLSRPDVACALPHIVGRAERRAVTVAMANAFAFGGANCSLVLRRCA